MGGKKGKSSNALSSKMGKDFLVNLGKRQIVTIVILFMVVMA